MGHTTIYKKILDIPHIHFKCGKYQRMFHRIFIVPQHMVTDMNMVNVPLFESALAIVCSVTIVLYVIVVTFIVTIPMK